MATVSRKSGHAEFSEATRSYLAPLGATSDDSVPETWSRRSLRGYSGRLSGTSWGCLGRLVTIVSRKFSHTESLRLLRVTWGYLGLLVMIVSRKSGDAEFSQATRGCLGLPGPPLGCLLRQGTGNLVMQKSLRLLGATLGYLGYL